MKETIKKRLFGNLRRGGLRLSEGDEPGPRPGPPGASKKRTNAPLYDGFHKIALSQMTNGDFRESLIMKDAVAAIVLDQNYKVAIVIQYRAPLGQDTLEIPAGVLDKEGLTPRETILEELEEECGFSEEEMAYLSKQEGKPFEFYPIIGSSSTKLTLFLFELPLDGKDKKIKNDDVKELRWIPIDEVKYFKDMKSSLAAHLYLSGSFRY